jgi:hypothetical protein
MQIVVLPIVLQAGKSWSLMLREEQNEDVSEQVAEESVRT